MFCPGSPTPPQAPDPELPAVQLPVPAREDGASQGCEAPEWAPGCPVSAREVNCGCLGSERPEVFRGESLEEDPL